MPQARIWSVALYIRLSQEDEDNGRDKLESNSVTGQKTLLNEFIEEHEELNIYDTYIDDGFTGTDFNRPGFQRMLQDMKNKKINCIVVKDLSRLGRNYIEVGNYIEQVFPLFNIRFIAINDFIDSFENPASTNTILVPFKNLINDEYCRDTSIKIRSSLEGKKRKGEFVGAFPSYGYIKDPQDKHKLLVDEESASIVRKIFDWKVNEGIGNLAICHRLNEMGILNPTGYKKVKLKQNYNNFKMYQEDFSWCPSTVRNILKNDIYIGNVTQGKRRVKSYKIHKVENVPEEEWVRVENVHEPIIEKELFQKAQSLRNVDIRVQKSGNLSMWAGILKCADCKRAMHKKTYKNKNGIIHEYYVCGTYRKKSKKLCTKHTLREDELEYTVLEIIKFHIKLYVDIDKIFQKFTLEQKAKDIGNIKSIKDMKNEKVEKTKEIERFKKLKMGLYEDWKNGDLTKEEYVEYKKKYEKKIEKLNSNILNLQKQEEQRNVAKNINCEWIENLKKQRNLIKLDRNIVLELIDYIEVYEGKKLAIHFKFSEGLGDGPSESLLLGLGDTP